MRRKQNRKLSASLDEDKEIYLMTTSNSLLLDVDRFGSNLGLALTKGVGQKSISSQGYAGESQKSIFFFVDVEAFRREEKEF
jgi:hypothetical protein